MTHEPDRPPHDGLLPLALSRLAVLEPDPARSDRTRRQCRDVLARHRTLSAPVRTAVLVQTAVRAGVPSRWRTAAIAMFCVLCAAYVGELMATAARLLGR